MTTAELKELIARGAAQPGVHEIEELMRLSQELDEQSRQLSELHAISLPATTSNSSVVPPTMPHAHVG